jgi:hypothetical protein
MRPVIRIGDTVRFAGSRDAPKFGEIWVAKPGNRQIVHRVLLVRRVSVLLKGDFNLRPDGWFPRSALFGPVYEIQHNGRWRPANRLRDRLLGLGLSAVGSSYQASRLVARRACVLVLGESRTKALAAALRHARGG